MKITKKRLVTYIILALILIFIIVGLIPKKKELNCVTQVAQKGLVTLTVTATGTLEPVDEVEIGTQVSGIVQKVYVDYNSHVKKGQLLAELDKSTLNERLSQAQSQITAAQSRLKYAQQNFERTKQLYNNNATTKVDYESSENDLVQAKTNLENAQIQYREAKVNLGYAEIYSTIDGVVLSKEIEEGQTVAASFNTPTLFLIAKDLKNMQVEASIDEADIGLVKKGQKVIFTVDAYNGEKFEGKVEEIRLSPKTTNNVVTYTVIIAANNQEEKLYPGMTASITIITKEEEGILIPLEAMSFNPSFDVLQKLGKPPRPEGMTEADFERMPKDMPKMENANNIWIKNGNDIHPCPISVGIDDGVNAILKDGNLKDGDTIILSATLEVPHKPKYGVDPFAPKGPNDKNGRPQGPPPPGM